MQALPHRQSWFAHERFPRQALLLESHDSFLAATEQFLERVKRVESGQGLKTRQLLRFAGRLEEEFRNLQWSMGCHERYEESKLYPFLTRRFGADCTALAAGHSHLHQLGAGCEQSLAQAAADLRDGGTQNFAGAQERVRSYHAALAQHLADEESLVIPLLLSLSPADFAEYSGAESCVLDLTEDSVAS